MVRVATIHPQIDFGISIISQLVAMVEELTEVMKKFALSNEECSITNLDVGDSSLSKKECLLSLMGKVRSERVANFTGVKNFVSNAWGYPKDLKVTKLGPNLFQFIIPDEEDQDRVVSGDPWVMDNQLLILEKWYEGIEDDQNAFISPMWVQMWNLPIHWISKEVGKKIYIPWSEGDHYSSNWRQRRKTP
ncbi:uncharacterized protein [Coffea arabica]|uniref:DUF4283 domain-containing protein n=1 Tax=Coffea arabica TaxID=13443 RepID=A0A6P6V0C1_COFAR|nr:uncharacterized protein LOC113716038 [Coffea arabica]